MVGDPASGEVWWGAAPDAEGRPYVVLTRDEAIAVRRTVLIAPVTRTVRGIPSEVPLGATQGLGVDCAATIDYILAFPKSMLTRRMARLPRTPSGESVTRSRLRRTADRPPARVTTTVGNLARRQCDHVVSDSRVRAESTWVVDCMAW